MVNGEKIKPAILILLISVFLSFWVRIDVSGQSYPLPDNSQQANYITNQVIVSFKESQSPQYLQTLVSERMARRKSFLGGLVYFFDELKRKITRKESPEEKLQRLVEANISAGVLESQEIEGGSAKNEIFLYTTDGKLSVEEAISMFESLPEVEYAEPNYLYDTLQY